MTVPLNIRDFLIWQEYLPKHRQEALVEDLRHILSKAPLFQPTTRHGPMSVRMTAAGRFGWISDQQGYRYSETHPNGTSWPPIPVSILDIWNDLIQCDRMPECCLINWYGEGARMGLHQDKDEADFRYPVLSISLGDDGLFRIGHEAKGGSTASLWLRSGDVVSMGGAARLKHHGVDRLRFGSSALLPKGGRINVTLRVVTAEND